MADNNKVENTSLTEIFEKKDEPRKNKGQIVCYALMVFSILAAIFLFHNIITNGATAMSDSYKSAFASERERVYLEQYQKYFDAAEAEYHVTNRASINIGNIQETERLEVLKVRDVEFVVKERDQNDDNIIAWLEVPGEGTFVVDLRAAEFIIDDERSYILVRLPFPELTNVTIDYPKVNKLLFIDDIFNGSYEEGEELARAQLGEGDLLIKKEFASNENFYLNAQSAAISTIECLIRQLNPTIDDLKVEIEFY